MKSAKRAVTRKIDLLAKAKAFKIQAHLVEPRRPTRAETRFWRAFVSEKITTQQAAAALQIPLTNVNYHLGRFVREAFKYGILEFKK